jgi:hypothetical protein
MRGKLTDDGLTEGEYGSSHSGAYYPNIWLSRYTVENNYSVQSEFYCSKIYDSQKSLSRGKVLSISNLIYIFKALLNKTRY